MNKIKRSLFAFAILCPATMFTACGGDDDDDEPGVGSSNVEFQSRIYDFSRATDTSFSNGDAISVWAMESSNYYTTPLYPSQSYANNRKYTYQGGRFKGDIRKPDNAIMNYYAVYPYGQYSDHFNFSVKTDQSNEANYRASDLCVARTNALTSPLVDMNFDHAMCKIIINVDDSFGTVSSIELPNVKQSATIDLNDYTARSYGAAASIKMLHDGYNSYKALFACMTIQAGTPMAIIHASQGDFVWNIEESGEFEVGNVYVIDLTRSNDNETSVDFSMYIQPWETIY